MNNEAIRELIDKITERMANEASSIPAASASNSAAANQRARTSRPAARPRRSPFRNYRQDHRFSRLQNLARLARSLGRSSFAAMTHAISLPA